MRYMLLMQRPQSAWQEASTISPEDMKAHGERMMALDQGVPSSNRRVSESDMVSGTF